MSGQLEVVTSTNYKGIDHAFSKILDNSNILPEKIARRGVNSPVLSYFGNRTSSIGAMSDIYTGHEYDLYEYSRIIDTEAIVYKAFGRKKTVMLKNGYVIKSLNSENEKYIKKRLREFKFVSGVSFDEFLEQLCYNLISFHNSYVLFVRNEEKSSANKRDLNGNLIDPVAALFNLPTESVERVISDNGEVRKYRQRVDSHRTRVFNARDVYHIKYNMRTGFTMGTPPLEPVKDDIIALRRIEESIETLIYKSLFPIIHVKVGTKENPAQINRDGKSEVTEMNRVLNDIDDYGGVVTSERVEIKSIGAESLALRVESYLKHFLERVMIGVGMSATDLGIGDSSGKSTGSIISQNLKEEVEDMQRVIARFITDDIFTELLIESGKYSAKYEIPEDDIVSFEFNKIDQDSQIKKESHLLNLANSGMITAQEFRLDTGRKELSNKDLEFMGKWAESVMPKVEVESIKSGMNNNQNDETKTSEKASSKRSIQSSSNNTTKSKGSDNLAKSNVSPKNQFSDSMKFIDKVMLYKDNPEMLKDILMDEIISCIDIDNNNNMIIIDNMCEAVCDSVMISNSELFIGDVILDLFTNIEDICKT